MPELKKTTEQKKIAPRASLAESRRASARRGSERAEEASAKKAEAKTAKPAKAVLKKKTVAKQAKVAPAKVSAEEVLTALPSAGFQGKYFEAVGRRKTAVARVRLYEKENGEFIVNKKEFAVYFPTEDLKMLATGALRKVKVNDKFAVSVLVKGGGSRAQAEATRLGSARALLKFDGELRERLKHAGYLRRDPREVERKKYGLKKARRKPQWTKR